MERKIGEIFEYNGEWYQCIRSILTCSSCEIPRPCTKIRELGYCSPNMRNDKEQVVFKKLEKVGEPRKFGKKLMQNYKVFVEPYIPKELEYFTIKSARDLTILIEIKQNKENMEIDKVVMNINDRDYLLDRLEAILHDTHCQQYKDEICEAFSKYIITENVSDLKPFDLNAAKAGKPVCTRDGRKARIICFDKKKDIYPLIALVTDKDGYEITTSYKADGAHPTIPDYDLMMLPEKKEGWIIVSKNATIYDSLEDARKSFDSDKKLCICKVEWEE